MPEKRYRRLKVSEFKLALSQLRECIKNSGTYYRKQLTDNIAALVEHVNYLEKENEELARDLRQIRQAEMFPAETKPQPIPQQPKPIFIAMSVGEKWWHRFQKPKNSVQGILKYSAHNVSDLIEQANQWAKENGKPLVSIDNWF